jgi:hypothetical protein
MVLTAAFVAVSITDTVLSPSFATYACRPSGVTVIPTGPLPTAMMWMTVCVAVSISETVFVVYVRHISVLGDLSQ